MVVSFQIPTWRGPCPRSEELIHFRGLQQGSKAIENRDRCLAETRSQASSSNRTAYALDYPDGPLRAARLRWVTHTDYDARGMGGLGGGVEVELVPGSWAGLV